MCSWQCGCCGVWYSFAVQSCDCSKYLYITTSSSSGSEPHIAQQLKPEMPSFADVIKDVQFMTVDEGNKAFVVYSNIARHFGR